MKIIKKAHYMLPLFLPITTFGFSFTIVNKSNYNYCQFTIWTYPVNFDALYGRHDIKKVVKPGEKFSIKIKQNLQNTPLTSELIPKDANLDIHIFSISFESPKGIQEVEKNSVLIIKDLIEINQQVGFKMPNINIHIDENDNMAAVMSVLVFS